MSAYIPGMSRGVGVDDCRQRRMQQLLQLLLPNCPLAPTIGMSHLSSVQIVPELVHRNTTSALVENAYIL